MSSPRIAPPLPFLRNADQHPSLPHLAEESCVVRAIHDARYGHPGAAAWLRNQLLSHEVWFATYTLVGVEQRAEQIEQTIAAIRGALDGFRTVQA